MLPTQILLKPIIKIEFVLSKYQFDKTRILILESTSYIRNEGVIQPSYFYFTGAVTV